MTTAISIDIETMSTAPNAAIASIGACRFAIGGDGIGDWIGDTFHVHVSLANCQRHGLAIDASTVLWWLGQDDNARSALIGGQQDAAPLVTALEALANFIDATDDGGQALRRALDSDSLQKSVEYAIRSRLRRLGSVA